MRSYFARGSLHVRGVGHLMNIERCRHTNGNKVALGHTRKVGRRFEHAGFHKRGQILLDHIANVVLTTVDHVRPFHLHVEADSLEARLCLLNCKRQPHVPKTNRATDKVVISNSFFEPIAIHTLEILPAITGCKIRLRASISYRQSALVLEEKSATTPCRGRHTNQ